MSPEKEPERSSLRLIIAILRPSLLVRHFSRKVMPRGVKKENLPSKLCVTCERPFTWRKKWENCWDEVTTCSKSCNGKRKKGKQLEKRQEDQSSSLDEKGVDQDTIRTKDCSICQEGVLEAFRVRYDESKQWKFVCRGCWPKASGRVTILIIFYTFLPIEPFPILNPT